MYKYTNQKKKFFRFFSFLLFDRCIFDAEVNMLYHSLSLVLTLLLAVSSWLRNPEPEGEAFIVFWNLENFFDWKAGNGGEEFSSYSKRHWTKRKFEAKCNAVAKALLWIADKEGGLPDIVGLAEVENRFVLKRLLEDTALRKAEYSIIHYDSPDPRGIDVALLYRESRLSLLDSKPLHIPSLETRDILLATFLTANNDSLAVLVNHHPSKYGKDSGWKREAALWRLRSATDSLSAEGYKHIVAMGDFNDTPDNPAFGILTGPGGPGALEDLAFPLWKKGIGSIKYSGKWELIDLFFVSEALVNERRISPMEIIRVPFLSARDNTHSGEKPLRTYTGPRYSGGVSDHRPVMIKIR